MNIAIYVPWIYQKGGIERVLINYCKNSKHKITIFTNNFQKENTFDEFRELNIVELSKVTLERNYFDLIKMSLKIMNQKINLDNFDKLVVFSSGFGEFITIKNNSKPIICYCCTPLKIIHDKETKNEFLKNNLIKKAVFFGFNKIYKLYEKKAWSNFEKCIAISNETKDRIIKAKLINKNKIKVITPGVNIQKASDKIKFEKYFFVPGRFIWHKNFELAINGFKEFSKENKDFKLIIAGGLDKKNKSYFNKLKKMSENEDIRFIISPTDKQMFKLYNNCYAVLFTAINEDFGIVPIEGMTFSKPIISVNEGGPKETIIHNKTGFLLNKNPKEFSKKMIELSNNLNLTKKIGKNAFIHSKEYDWKKIVKKLDKEISE
ncbi:MAG: glycosyltransferase [Candidatus ainarchaeum sp.]|nr:glycosyltransferase [Candidatus ainarchaeum sp.]